jgi:hypothetical protein
MPALAQNQRLFRECCPRDQSLQGRYLFGANVAMLRLKLIPDNQRAGSV